MANRGCFGINFGGNGKKQQETPDNHTIDTSVIDNKGDTPKTTSKDIIKAYWVWSEDSLKMDVNLIKQQGITDLFVISDRFGGNNYYETFLPKVVAKFNGNPRIHAWIPCFKDKDKKWVNPADEGFQNTLLDIIGKISAIAGLNGIHLDYVRYTGDKKNNQAASQQTPHGKITITNFVEKVENKVKSTNPGLKLSAALMPEGQSNADSYGQDYQELAKYLDWLCPMIYKGNYKGADTVWIGKKTSYINDKAQNKVIAGLQGYRSDDDPTKIPESELKADIQIALDNGAIGFALFRYGLADYSGGV
ncbi:MAG: hypothetical protein FJW63_08745 [Actinobacteria bacterium]|nr:hypothetical protein [Actinomycetota bacterium]